MENFAETILAEKDFNKKIELILRLQNVEEITFNNGIIFKAIIVKLFAETMNINVNINRLTTAALLCMCKKVENSQDMKRIETYAKEGSDFLKTLGFSKEFCTICEQHNRYSGNAPRLPESQILEIADQLGGMLMSRPERPAFNIEEAIVLLEYRNFKGVDNPFLQKFKEFINIIKEIIV